MHKSDKMTVMFAWITAIAVIGADVSSRSNSQSDSVPLLEVSINSILNISEQKNGTATTDFAFICSINYYKSWSISGSSECDFHG